MNMRIGYSTTIRTDCLILEDLECELDIGSDNGEVFDIGGITMNGRNPFRFGPGSLDATIATRILANAESDLNTYGSKLRQRAEEAWEEEREPA